MKKTSLFKFIFLSFLLVAAPIDSQAQSSNTKSEQKIKYKNDPEFIAAYELSVKTKPDMIVGAQGELIMKDLDQINPKLLEFIKDYIDPKI